MLVGAGVASAVPGIGVHVPAPALKGAFALVGLDVGLRFTGDVLRHLGRLMPVLGLCIALLLGVSFVLALLLTVTTSVSLLDAYLAATPGGLMVVASTAYGTGANTALITAIQMVRLIVMLATAPALVRLTVSAVQMRARPGAR
jgi:membrane AbrB-like protein